jgi:DNA topoisomerase I
VKHGSEFRSLEPEDDVYTITLERARDLLAQPKKSMRRQRAAAKELKALGAHPRVGRARAHPRRPLRPLRHRRHHQRLAAQGPAPEEVTMERRGRCSTRAAERFGEEGRAKAAQAASRRRRPRRRPRGAKKKAR